MAPTEYRTFATTLRKQVEDEVGSKKFLEELDGLINWAKSLKQLLPVSVTTHQRMWPGTGPSNDGQRAESPPEVPVVATPEAATIPTPILVPVIPRKLDFEPLPLPEGEGLAVAGQRYATAVANMQKAQAMYDNIKVLFEEASVYCEAAKESVDKQHQNLLETAQKSQL
jgi:hypothetical protein